MQRECEIIWTCHVFNHLQHGCELTGEMNLTKMRGGIRRWSRLWLWGPTKTSISLLVIWWAQCIIWNNDGPVVNGTASSIELRIPAHTTTNTSKNTNKHKHTTNTIQTQTQTNTSTKHRGTTRHNHNHSHKHNHKQTQAPAQARDRWNVRCNALNLKCNQIKLRL